MIDDLSRTLDGLLNRSDLPNELRNAAITFEQPKPTFNPTNTVNLFLFDIQENLELRSNEPRIIRKDNQAFRQQAPPRMACSYLVTAYPPNGPDPAFAEQLLLSQTFTALAAFPIIPDSFLVGKLHGKQEPLPPMTVARGDELRHNAEFWTALGGNLRAALRVTVTISIPVFDDQPSEIVTAKTTRFASGLDDAAGTVADSLVHIGGRVISNTGNAIEGAVVDIVDAGLRAQTNSEGRFSFPLVPLGNRQFRVIATGFQPLAQTRPVPGSSEEYLFQLTP